MTASQKLITAAQKARQHAFAPGSHYKVGAAVLCEKNKIVVGCNVENSQFLPVGTCAEVTALHSARAQGFKKFKTLAIVSDNGVGPCGKCREVIWDHNPEMELVLVDRRGQVQKLFIDELLPLKFAKISRSS